MQLHIALFLYRALNIIIYLRNNIQFVLSECMMILHKCANLSEAAKSSAHIHKSISLRQFRSFVRFYIFRFIFCAITSLHNTHKQIRYKPQIQKRNFYFFLSSFVSSFKYKLKFNEYFGSVNNSCVSPHITNDLTNINIFHFLIDFNIAFVRTFFSVFDLNIF